MGFEGSVMSKGGASQQVEAAGERNEFDLRQDRFLWCYMLPVVWVFLCSGRREGSDPRGESLRKIFVPGLPPAEKNQICSNVDMSTDFKSADFSRKKKNQQMSRQTVNRFGFLGHPIR
jgi:hypothetical protein